MRVAVTAIFFFLLSFCTGCGISQEAVVQTAPDAPGAVVIEDSALECCIRETTGKQEGQITGQDLLGMTEITISSNGQICLDELAMCRNLNKVVLSGAGISDISFVAALPAMESFSAIGINTVDYSALSKAKSIREVSIAMCGIEDISFVKEMDNIEKLLVYNTSLSDLTPLENKCTLKELSLSANGISDITPLGSLINLETLSLSVNYIEDISALSHLHRLTHLYLSANMITDFSALDGLDNLVELDISSQYTT